MTCANCDAPITQRESALYDDRAELHFCDEQCFHEWAEDKGAETVREFYRELNVSEVTADEK